MTSIDNSNNSIIKNGGPCAVKVVRYSVGSSIIKIKNIRIACGVNPHPQQKFYSLNSRVGRLIRDPLWWGGAYD